jgi:hypothetical protein
MRATKYLQKLMVFSVVVRGRLKKKALLKLSFQESAGIESSNNFLPGVVPNLLIEMASKGAQARGVKTA